MAATIKQVAKLADVSPATVSYVLNGTGTVTETTRQRVLQADVPQVMVVLSMPHQSRHDLVGVLFHQPFRADRIRSTLQVGNDLRHIEPEFELQPYVRALLAGQWASHFDADVLLVQDAHDPGHRRSDRVGSIAGFAQGGTDQSFNFHGPS